MAPTNYESLGESSESPIRPRRAFKKSRRGCKTCKERKVKCDEKHPICGGCSRRFPGLTKCDFDHFIDPPKRAKKQKAGAERQLKRVAPALLRPSIEIKPTSTSDHESLRVLELRLMHHYTTTTAQQLPDGYSLRGRSMWSMDIPRIAFDSELVLSAVLGISSLHLWALTPDDMSLYHAAGRYFDRAVRNHRQALITANKNTAESILATAILITHYTWVSGHTANPDGLYELPLQTYYMARGLQTLFIQWFPWLEGSSYLWYAEQQPLLDIDVTSSDPFLLSAREDLAILSETFDEEEVSSTDRIVYAKTVSELLLTYVSISTCAEGCLQRRVATLPLRLPPRFLELAENKDPRALALLARNLCLLKLVDKIWWLHGTGESQKVPETAIEGIDAMLTGEWAWAMEWPKKVIEGQIQLGRRVENGLELWA